MKLGIFSSFKKSKDDKSQASGSPVKRDPRKARPWFQRAQDVSATNHDYAIECFVNGFKHDPDNMTMHEAMREVALKRKVAGGKPAGMLESMKSAGSDSVDKMIHAERLLAMDPANAKHARDMMKHAIAANEAYDEFNMGEVAHWAGRLTMELNGQAKKPDKGLFLEVCDLFQEVPDYKLAVTACRKALQLSPDDSELMTQLKQLEAEEYARRQRGDSEEVEAGHFRSNIKDADKQAAIQQDESVTRSDRMVEEMIERRRGEYEEDPSDQDRATKFVDALLKKPGKETEDEAITVLKQLHEQTGQYRFKVRYTDLQMRQMSRIVKNLREKAQANPQDAEAAKNHEEALRRQLAFELKEFKDRVDNYPTDMGLRFEYGRRLFAVGQLDDAISEFQQAKSDPKHRSQAHWYLAQCYLKQDWYEEAIDTVREGIENHPTDNDRIGLELRYLLMDALANIARKNNDIDSAREAQKVASGILQTNINFRDIKERMSEIRSLVEELQTSAQT